MFNSKNIHCEPSLAHSCLDFSDEVSQKMCLKTNKKKNHGIIIKFSAYYLGIISPSGIRQLDQI